MGTFIEIPQNALITGDTFVKSKNYKQVIIQGLGKRPLLDSEINEIQEYINNRTTRLLKCLGNLYINNAFKVVQSTTNTNNFLVTLGEGLLAGEYICLNSGIEYKDQTDDRTFIKEIYWGSDTTVPALTTPTSDRLDLVVLHLAMSEINSTQDSAIKNVNLNKETAIRWKINIGISVIENFTGDIDNINDSCNYYNTDYVFRLPLAYLNRLAGNATITTAMIEDLRTRVVSTDVFSQLPTSDSDKVDGKNVDDTLTTDQVLWTAAKIINYVQSSLGSAARTYVLSFWDASSGLPISPSEDDSYICSVSGNGWAKDTIYIRRSGVWVANVPLEGCTTYVINLGRLYYYVTELGWSSFGTVLSHLNLNDVLIADWTTTGAEARHTTNTQMKTLYNHTTNTNNPHSVSKEQISGLKSTDTPTFAGATIGNVSNTELQYLEGVTSRIQTQLNAKLESSAYTASDILTKIKTVDGEGSGLDADMLSGLYKKDYLRRILDTTLYTGTSITDWATVLHTGLYYANLGIGQNSPFISAAPLRVLTLGDDTNATQIGFSETTYDYMWLRTKYSGSWTPSGANIAWSPVMSAHLLKGTTASPVSFDNLTLDGHYVVDGQAQTNALTNPPLPTEDKYFVQVNSYLGGSQLQQIATTFGSTSRSEVFVRTYNALLTPNWSTWETQYSTYNFPMYLNAQTGTLYTPYANASGNVGIGATNPAQRLSLGNAAIRFDESTGTITATTATLGSGAGNLSNGVYYYKITFYNNVGESLPGTASNSVTVVSSTTNGKINLTNIPVGTDGTTVGRKIYRTLAGGSTYYYLATIADNTTTTYADNIADTSLGALAPKESTYTGAFFRGSTEGFRIQGSGKVRFGTPTAGATLAKVHIADSSNAVTNICYLENSNTGTSNGAALAMQSGTTGAIGYLIKSGLENTSAANLTDYFYMLNSGAGVALIASGTSGLIDFYAGDSSTKRASITSSGLIIYSYLTFNFKGSSIAIGPSALGNAASNGRRVAIGDSALCYDTESTTNIGIGYHAGMGVSGTGCGRNNVFIGYQAGEAVASTGSGADGKNNTFIGFQTGPNLTVGIYNTLGGSNSGALLTTGSYNCFWGSNSGHAITTESYSVFIGFQSGYTAANGDNKIGIGAGSLNFDILDSSNVGVGTNALRGNASYNSGQFNTAIGYQAGSVVRLTTGVEGSYNVFAGYQAGIALTTGAENVIIGALAAASATTMDTSVVIGREAVGSGVSTGYSNTIIGYRSGYNLTVGDSVVFIGENSGRNNTTEEGCVFIGASCGFAAANGGYKVGIGYHCLYYDKLCSDNVGVGAYALIGNISYNSGQFNTAIGSHAGRNVRQTSGSEGSYSVFVGYYSGSDITTGTHNINIGANVSGDTVSSNEIRIGKHYLAADTYTTCYIGGIASGTGSTTLFIDTTTKQIKYNSSSIRYKQKIQELTDSKILDLYRAIVYNPKEGYGDVSRQYYGFLAEELDLVDPRNVGYGPNGPESVDYARITVLLTKRAQEQSKIIEMQSEQIAELKEELSLIKDRINQEGDSR